MIREGLGKAGAGAARAEQGGPSHEAVRDLKALLYKVKMEFGAEEEGVPGEFLSEVIDEMVMGIIRAWASYYELEIDEEAELCEANANTYASGIGFSHSVCYACYAVLTTGEHVHVEIREGYTRTMQYIQVTEVNVVKVEEDNEEGVEE